MFSALSPLFGSSSRVILSSRLSPGFASARMWQLCLQALMIVIAVVVPIHMPAMAQGSSSNVWRNPSNSVHIRAERCGDRMCGVVVWASEKAKADARKGSQKPLVGSPLFRDFVEERPGVWRGQVFVPDIGRTFTGTIRVVDANRLEAKGCLLGNLGCRSQQWVRVTPP